jgi:hypothetical protein
VISDEEDDGEEEICHAPGSGHSSGETKLPYIEVLEETNLQEGVKGLTISTLLGVPKYYTFRVKGILQE